MRPGRRRIRRWGGSERCTAGARRDDETKKRRHDAWVRPFHAARTRPSRRSFHGASTRLADIVPLDAIFFDFDPTIDIGDREVTLWSLLTIAGVMLALASAAFLAARSRGPDGDRLSQIDLWMMVLGAVPGAVIGGRLGYALIHYDYYLVDPISLFYTGQGSFQLSCAIVGGALTGAYVARVIEAPVGRWLDVAAVPVLAIVVIGKMGMALGGAGQGSPSTNPPATAYLGEGPWGSLGPAIPSQPSQLYESGLTFAVLIILVALVAFRRFTRSSGTMFLVALELWAVARFLVAFTWRDSAVLGPLTVDQLISLGILAGCLMVHVATRRSSPAAPVPEPETVITGPAWPERNDPTGWRGTPGSRP